MSPEVFLDSSYAIALAAANDRYHAKAVALAAEMKRAGTRLVTTEAVFIEIGNALSKERYRVAAVHLLSSLASDPSVEIVSVPTELLDAAWQLYQQRLDKEWGLTDCISFIVMSRRELHEALTADQHFHQAGFKTLLETT